MENAPNLNWKTIPGFPKYAITPDGQIWSYYTNKFLKLIEDKDKYLKVNLYNDSGMTNWSVHRLVGMAFIPLPPEFNNDYDMATINHKDHNKANNYYLNLEWVTREYNSQEPWDNGYMDHMKKKCFCVSIEGKKYTPFDSARDMDRSLNLPEGAVRKAINNAKGILQGKYIVGYTEDLDQKYLLPKPDAVGIIQLYSDVIANYTPSKKLCFCVSIEDEKYTPFDSLSDMVRSLNLPTSTVFSAINQSNGILQGKYIVGYTEDLDQKYLLPKPDAVGIIQLYSDVIANYKPRGKECFCISIKDKKFTKRDSASDMDKSLNLPEGAVRKAINNAKGILQGKYIVGYTEDLDQKYLSPAPDAVGIIQLYSSAIVNYTPNKTECFLIDSSDNSYTPFDSYAAIDKHLNLPDGTTSKAISRSHGLIRGRYIAGAINDFRWKKILAANLTVEQIVESYAKKIERYKQRGPRKITNLETGESETYESLSEFAREQGILPNSVSSYLKARSDLYKVELA